MRSRVPLPALFLVLPLAACGDVGTEPGPPEEITELPRQLSVSEEEVIRASNRFAFDLADRISQPDSSFFVSPLSASMALGMTMNGADGGTYAQMRDVLGFGSLPEEEINASYASLIALLLELDPSVEMAIGNSVWIREGFPVVPDFLDRVEEHFAAEVANLDFSDPAASDRINGWVGDATRGRIEKIVPAAIPGNIVMYLINAIYFKGDWTEKFDPAETSDAPFHRSDGSTVTVPLMEKEFHDVGYTADTDFQAVDLPYGGKAFSMTVLLPRPDTDVESLLASLDAERWRQITEDLGQGKVHLYLPRFEMTWERILNGDLQALGMTDAFDTGRADFSRLTPGGGVWIDEVKQKSFVRVDEEGTEAAAATSVAVAESAGPTMRVDRPFLFAIRERLSGTILFLGKVVDPARE